MTVALERELLEGARTPRICVVPDGDEHPRWNEVLELLDKIGMGLDPWQMDVLHASLLRRGEMWAAFTVGVCAPRQNGKNEILQARELAGALLLGEDLIIHSAHLADTCIEAFMRMDDLIDSSDWLQDQIRHVRRTNGREAVRFMNNARIRFRTRTRGGGRGFSGSPVIFDESMFFPVISQNAILPVMSAQPDPQAWYTGSAVDQRDHDDGVVYARVRERALSGEDDRIAYFEWSLDYANPEDVPPHVAADAESWSATNPAMGIRITREYIAAERLELGERGFAVERLGVGDWPATDGIGDSPLSWEDWSGLEDVRSVLQDPICLAFDVSRDRNAAIVACGDDGYGNLLLEVVDARPGTGWVPDRVADLLDRHEVVEVVCDGYGPSASIANKVDEAGVNVRRLNTGEHGQACGQIVDAISAGTVRHLGQDELSNAVRGARPRPLGDAWAWSRKNSNVDISPLVAATLAHFSAAEQDLTGGPTIY